MERIGFGLTIAGVGLGLMGFGSSYLPAWLLPWFFIAGLLFVAAGLLALVWETRSLKWLRARIGRGPKVASGSERSGMIPMDKATLYISQSSRWIAGHQNDPPAQWVAALERDIHDALCLGRVTAYGRPMTSTVPDQGRPGTALEKLDTDVWRNHRPWIMDGLAGNPTSNKTVPVPPNRSGGVCDVHFDEVEVKRVWPPLGRLERRRYKPLGMR